MRLAGHGFTLREWKLDDAASLQKHADNKNIASFLLDRFPSPYTIEDATGWISTKLNQNPVSNFAIDIDGQVAGVIGLDFREDVYRKAPLLGYWVSEAYWGRGITAEAIKLITDYCFNRLDIVRIQAGVLSNNPKSMRVLEKAGYTKEGILKKNIIKNGMILDEHIYAMVKMQV
jgi:[ribosomal protein S5]-alanine N-acetyltransferase